MAPVGKADKSTGLEDKTMSKKLNTTNNTNTTTTSAVGTLRYHCYWIFLKDPKRKSALETAREDARKDGALEHAKVVAAEMAKKCKAGQSVVVVDYKKYLLPDGSYKTENTNVFSVEAEQKSPKAKAPKAPSAKNDELDELKQLVAKQTEQIAALMALLSK